MGRTLAIHPGALGDVLLAIPALRALKSLAPADELVLAAPPRIGALLTALGVVDRSLGFDALRLDALFVDDESSARLELLADVARVVCWFGARDPVFVRRLSRLAPETIVAPAVGAADVLVWEYLLATVEAPAGNWCRPVTVPSALADTGGRALRAIGWEGGAPLVMIHPGAGSDAKRWPPEGFARVIERMRERVGTAVVIHEGPADREAVATLSSHLRPPACVLRNPPLDVLAGALTHVAAFLGNDSGVSHLAAAVGAPAVILFLEANLAWRPWSLTTRPLVVSTAPLERGDGDAVAAALMLLLEAR